MPFSYVSRFFCRRCGRLRRFLFFFRRPIFFSAGTLIPIFFSADTLIPILVWACIPLVFCLGACVSPPLLFFSGGCPAFHVFVARSAGCGSRGTLPVIVRPRVGLGFVISWNLEGGVETAACT